MLKHARLTDRSPNDVIGDLPVHRRRTAPSSCPTKGGLNTLSVQSIAPILVNSSEVSWGYLQSISSFNIRSIHVCLAYTPPRYQQTYIDVLYVLILMPD